MSEESKRLFGSKLEQLKLQADHRRTTNELHILFVTKLIIGR